MGRSSLNRQSVYPWVICAAGTLLIFCSIGLCGNIMPVYYPFLAAEKGFAGRTADYIRVTDREKAIQAAIGRARPGDTIVIAGKGHENYQEICGVKHPFDDRAVVRRLCGGAV